MEGVGLYGACFECQQDWAKRRDLCELTVPFVLKCRTTASMYIRGRKMPKEIKFELRGLAEKDYTNEKNWKLSTLKTIVQDNKHENSIIDILKIDVEGAEWKSLPPAIEAGVLQRVKQILIELHASRMGPKMDKGFWGDVDLAGQLRVLRLLHEAGFRIFMREHNMYSITDFAVPPENQITIVNEISLININFKKDLVND